MLGFDTTAVGVVAIARIGIAVIAATGSGRPAPLAGFYLRVFGGRRIGSGPTGPIGPVDLRTGLSLWRGGEPRRHGGVCGRDLRFAARVVARLEHASRMRLRLLTVSRRRLEATGPGPLKPADSVSSHLALGAVAKERAENGSDYSTEGTTNCRADSCTERAPGRRSCDMRIFVRHTARLPENPN